MRLIAKCCLLMFLIVVCVNVNAQHRGAWGHHNSELLLTTMTEKLSLDDTQITAIKEILIEQKVEIEALKNGADKYEMREQMHQVKAETQTKIKGELNEEQLTIFSKWQEKRAERGDKPKGRKGDRCGGDFKGKKDKGEVKAALLKMRVELENEISRKDKKELKALRTVMQQAKEEKKAFFESQKAKGERPSREEMETQKAKWDEKYSEDWSKVLSLSKKYDDKINQLFTENDFDMANKSKACCTKEEAEVCCAEKEACKPKDCGKTKGKKGKFGKRGDLKARFLLMNPKANQQDVKISDVMPEVSTIKVNPNPIANNAKVFYTVKNEGLIKIDLIDESGNLVKNLLNEYKQVGSYEFDFVGADSKSKFLFITIQDEQGINNEKLLMQKR